MGAKEQDFFKDSYQLEVPDSLIAQHPRDRRHDSRLMVLDRYRQQLHHSCFGKLTDFLQPESCLVANNSKVFPARLKGRKESTSGGVELLLTTPPPLLEIEEMADGWRQARAQAAVRPAKRIRSGHRLLFSQDLIFLVGTKKDYGQVEGDLLWRGDLDRILQTLGQMPLPPYIKREQEARDWQRYQTVYAREEKKGSAASPTAGLHFTPSVFDRLREKNITWTEISLHVGYGTFNPIKERDIRDHTMHAEFVEVSPECARRVNKAKGEGRPVVAVGTTSVRALESAALSSWEVAPYRGWTDLYIYPGYEFRVVDHMITNFHLPDSSLILMVSAFAGREQLLHAYKSAIEQGYRFFSYGDAMLIM